MSTKPFANIQGLWGQAEAGSRIFVSYRRDDARGDAGRLTDKLKFHFGDKQIFRDVEAIEAGVDFVEAINSAVSQCAVLLAIIGPNWLKVTDSQGRRRLDDRNDFVRLEIAAALQRNIRVVPVLVGGAVMPKAEDLPQGLESLARRQAHELSDPRWDFDVGQLVETLESPLGANLPLLNMGSNSLLNSPNNEPLPARRPDVPPRNEPARQPLAYRGFDAIGRYPTLVQVLNPG